MSMCAVLQLLVTYTSARQLPALQQLQLGQQHSCATTS
jgi:hypothetical protein